MKVFPSIATGPKLYCQFPTPVAAPFRSESEAEFILFFVVKVARIIISGIKLGYLVPRYKYGTSVRVYLTPCGTPARHQPSFAMPPVVTGYEYCTTVVPSQTVPYPRW